jgi:hypothetical protein
MTFTKRDSEPNLGDSYAEPEICGALAGVTIFFVYSVTVNDFEARAGW